MEAKRSWSREDVVAKMIAQASEQFGIEASTITEASSFRDDLGADSLDAIEMIMAFEEAFDIELTDDDAEKAETIGGTADAVMAKLRADGREKLP